MTDEELEAEAMKRDHDQDLVNLNNSSSYSSDKGNVEKENAETEKLTDSEF